MQNLTTHQPYLVSLDVGNQDDLLAEAERLLTAARAQLDAALAQALPVRDDLRRRGDDRRRHSRRTD